MKHLHIEFNGKQKNKAALALCPFVPDDTSIEFHDGKYFVIINGKVEIIIKYEIVDYMLLSNVVESESTIPTDEILKIQKTRDDMFKNVLR